MNAPRFKGLQMYKLLFMIQIVLKEKNRNLLQCTVNVVIKMI